MPKHNAKRDSESSPEVRQARRDIVEAKQLVGRRTKKGIVNGAEEIQRLILMLETGLSPRSRMISDQTRDVALRVLKKSILAALRNGERVDQEQIERTTKIIEAEGMKVKALRKAARGAGQCNIY